MARSSSACTSGSSSNSRAAASRGIDIATTSSPGAASLRASVPPRIVRYRCFAGREPSSMSESVGRNDRAPADAEATPAHSSAGPRDGASEVSVLTAARAVSGVSADDRGLYSEPGSRPGLWLPGERLSGSRSQPRAKRPT
jgi:hypothetical protein